MQDRQQIKNLFEKYSTGQCTPEEQARLHAWFNSYTRDEASGLAELQAAYEADVVKLRRRRFRWVPYAAAVLLVALSATWLYFDNQINPEAEIVNLPSDIIQPGGNKAVLTLTDGRVIDLSANQSGIIVGSEMTYLDGSEIFDNGLDTREESPMFSASSLMSISTPRGGQYQITLPDGTHVWLNAGSTLKYPSRFTGVERIVELEGEAYFDVRQQALDSRRLMGKVGGSSVSSLEAKVPFIVKTRHQTLKVLGTQFNISAYADEPETQTTLVEGSVRLAATGGSVTLAPGEQGRLQDDGTLYKQRVDVTPYTAWKAGNFYFDDTPLSEMMKQIARWYDVEVVYEGKVPVESFSGMMARSVTLPTVLELLRISEIRYRIEERKLIIQ